MQKPTWKIKEIKRDSRKDLKKNYWSAVIVCLILAVFTSSFTYTTLLDIDFSNASRNNDLTYGIELFENFIMRFGIDRDVFSSRGVLAAVYRGVSNSGSIIYGILNVINQFVFGKEVLSGIMIIIGILIYLVYWLLIGNMLTVGACRFFLETKNYSGTQPKRVLFIFRIRRILKIAGMMLLQMVYIVLWSFTIAGGIIKAYSYKMVPYILAENPDIPSKEVFRISRQMINGSKWKTFLLDASYWGWYLLSMPTMGVLSILFINPYKTAAEAELYFELRKKHLEVHPDDQQWLNDTKLVEKNERAKYPEDSYSIPEAASRKWINADYTQKYPLLHIVLMFFGFMMIGWIWEVALEIFGKGLFVNRGTLFGPWLPLYGCGGILMILTLKKTAHRPVKTYFLAVAVCAVLEYFTGFILERVMGMRWWDYTGYFLNLHGRVCLEGLIVFGIGGCLMIYFLAPLFHNLFSRIPEKGKVFLCLVLIILFVIDLGYSVYHPNMGENITFAMAVIGWYTAL